jgi:ribose transport system substrate-binding protein
MHKSRIALLALAAAGSLALSACSSNGSSSSGGTAGTGTAAKASSYNASAAAKVVDAALKNPTLIGITTPLTKKPPTGEFIVIVGTPTPVALLKDEAMAAAGRALGWRVVRLVEGTTPEAPAQTMMQAIQLKPDMILFSGTDLATLSAPLKQAAADHIPVLAETVTGSKTDSIISTAIDGPSYEAYTAYLMANYVAMESKGKADVALVNLPIFPILNAYASAFKSDLRSVCPGCRVTDLDQPPNYVDTQTPGNIVSVLERSPSINWIVYTVGDLSLGVDSALQAAGMLGKVSIGGNAPDQTNLVALKNGTETAWTGFSTPILGFRDADMMARYFAGDSLSSAGEPLLLPTQILTKSNIGQASLTSAGNYQGVSNYVQQFSTLWKLP